MKEAAALGAVNKESEEADRFNTEETLIRKDLAKALLQQGLVCKLASSFHNIEYTTLSPKT